MGVQLLWVPRSSSRSRSINLLANASRYDPTKTNAIRVHFERELVRRFRALAKEARDYFMEDRLRLSTNASRDKVSEFMGWLRRAQDRGILETSTGVSSGRAKWSDLYIRSAYQRGLKQAYGSLKAEGIQVADKWVDGAFFRPIHADRAGLIYTRAYTELEGITRAVDTRLSGILSQGIIEGIGPMDIAGRIVEGIESVGITRARVLARTEVIRAHAEATLNSYEEAGIEGVDVVSEFSTSLDNKVCPKCAGLEGKQYSVEEARGVIPVHPNCRCSWIPVVTEATSRRIG